MGTLALKWIVIIYGNVPMGILNVDCSSSFIQHLVWQCDTWKIQEMYIDAQYQHSMTCSLSQIWQCFQTEHSVACFTAATVSRDYLYDCLPPDVQGVGWIHRYLDVSLQDCLEDFGITIKCVMFSIKTMYWELWWIICVLCISKLYIITKQEYSFYVVVELHIALGRSLLHLVM